MASAAAVGAKTLRLLSALLCVVAAMRRPGAAPAAVPASLLEAVSVSSVAETWPHFATLARGHLAFAGAGPRGAPGSAVGAPGREASWSPVSPAHATATALHAGLFGAAGRSGPRPEESLVPAMSFGDSDTVFPVGLPPEWERQLEPGKLHMTDLKWHAEGELGWPIMVFEATPRRAPTERLEFHIVQTGCPAAVQEQTLAARLGDKAANVMLARDTQVFKNSTFLMYPAVDMTLDTMMEDRTPKPREAPTKSLPILIDVLRGLVSLEAADAVHYDLTPQNVMMKDGRAYIGGLGKSCLGKSCPPGERARPHYALGSPFRIAPEVDSGKPVHPSNHMWSAGVLFAELLFGAKEAEEYLLLGPNTKFSSDDFKGRAEMLLRRIVPEDDDVAAETSRMREIRFNRLRRVERIPGFFDAAPLVQEILRNLLQENPAVRWSTPEALEVAQAVASEMGIRVPGPAPALRLPAAWAVAAP